MLQSIKKIKRVVGLGGFLSLFCFVVLFFFVYFFFAVLGFGGIM